jgi:pteridine reductase
MIEQIKGFGRIDVLVNCAADWCRKKLEEVTAADVRHYFEVNTLGTFLCCQHAGPAMVKQPEGGNIITLVTGRSRGRISTTRRTSRLKRDPTLTHLRRGTRYAIPTRQLHLPGPVMLPPDLPDAERTEAIQATLVKREGKPRTSQAVLSLIDNDFITGFVCRPMVED